MKVTPTDLDGVVLLAPRVFGDSRGAFWESYQQERYAAAGLTATFVQDNISLSKKNTLRGLHYQHPHGQAKLVQVLQGEIFDVALDIRVGSPTFGQWFGTQLSDRNHRQLYIPAGFAHGFCVCSDSALFMYKCSEYYAPGDEGGIHWDDPALAIPWPVEEPVLSPRDREWPRLGAIDLRNLPVYEGS